MGERHADSRVRSLGELALAVVPMLLPLPFLLAPTLLGAPSSVVRRNGFEVSLAAPKGWVVGSPNLKYDGLPAVFTREGEDFYTARSVMYLTLDPRKGQALSAYAADRRADYLRFSPRGRVSPAGTLPAGDGRVAAVFDHDEKAPACERRAYLETADGVATLYLRCRTPRDREAHAGAFRALVATFRDLHAPKAR